MNYNKDIFCNQYPIAKEFVYHINYYWALHRAYQENSHPSEFWKHTIDAHLLQATIKWCKVFGSYKQNQTHLRNLNPKDQKVRDSFLDGMNFSIGIEIEKYEEYRTKVTDFRNKFVAHTEIGFSAPVPEFTTALNITFYYDNWVRKIISPDYLAEGSLKFFSENLSKKVKQPIEKLVKESKIILKEI